MPREDNEEGEHQVPAVHVPPHSARDTKRWVREGMRDSHVGASPDNRLLQVLRRLHVHS